MKYVTYFLVLLFLAINSYAQCKDIYGHKTDCPSEADSLTIYNNALKVYEYYENNPKYKRTRRVELSSDMDKRNIFEDLATARRLFFVIRKEFGISTNPSQKKFAAGKPVPSYKDITYNQYYQEIDEYRFYQRELENQIVNINAPASLFDIRIAPVIVNEYHCVDSTDSHFGDLVNIVLYVPVTVKPVMLLTEDELDNRNEILSKIIVGYKPILKSTSTQNVDTTKKVEITNRTEQNTKDLTICNFAVPTYAYNSITGGALIGFVCGKTFIKIKPNEYTAYAVPKWAAEILEDDKKLSDLLKIKFGIYITNVE